jgi:hypothetical protein
MNESAGGKASSGYTVGEPCIVDLREKAGDLIPTGALAGFAGIADENDEEVETVAGGIDHAMGSTTDQIAENGEELKKQSGWMSFGVWGNGSDGEPGEAMESSRVEIRIRVRSVLWSSR